MIKKTNSLPLGITVGFQTEKNVVIPSLDWLQVQSKGIPKKSTIYQRVQLPIHTRTFEIVEEIIYKKWRHCTITHKPFSSVLNKEMVISKLDNRQLYYGSPVQHLLDIQKELGLQYSKPSRIDICIDFNEFINHKSCESFIIDFMMGNFWKKKCKNYQIYGKMDFENKPNGLKFSSKHSKVSVYLYNKSKEMKEVKKKQYIIDMWEKNGIDTNKDVWRLEFSIKDCNFNIINSDTGDIQLFNMELLDNKEYLSIVARTLVNQYFDIRYNNGEKKPNDMKRVKLFKKYDLPLEIIFMSEIKDSGRTERKNMNFLNDLNEELREQSTELRESITGVVNYYKVSRGLKKKLNSYRY